MTSAKEGPSGTSADNAGERGEKVRAHVRKVLQKLMTHRFEVKKNN